MDWTGTTAGAMAGAIGMKILPELIKKLFKNGGSNGNGNGMTIAYRRDMKEVFEETLKADVIPHLTEQTQFLQGIETATSAVKDNIIKLVVLQEARETRHGTE